MRLGAPISVQASTPYHSCGHLTMRRALERTTPIPSAISQMPIPYFASSDTPAITPAHSGARRSPSMTARASIYAHAVHAIGSKVEVVSVVENATSTGDRPMATPAIQARGPVAAERSRESGRERNQRDHRSDARKAQRPGVIAEKLRRRRQNRDQRRQIDVAEGRMAPATVK